MALLMHGGGMVRRRRADAGFRQPVLAQRLQRFNSEPQQVPFGDLLHLFAQRGVVHQLLDGEPGLMHVGFYAAKRFAAGADG